MRAKLALTILLILTTAQLAPAAKPKASTFAPPLFAFKNGLAFGSFDKEAIVLKSLGYNGAGSAPINGLEKRIKAYNTAGLKVFSIYVDISRMKDIIAAIPLIKSQNGTIELTVRSKITDQTIKDIRHLADTAGKAKVRVALYPHAGFAIAKIPQALKLIKQVNHPNLGVMFNLCHFLKSENPADLEKTIQTAGSRIFAASTCGADTNGKNWNKLIQPLDSGTFDQTRLFKALKSINFKGAVGIQCYAVKGDKRNNLKRSITAWKKILKQVNN